MGSEIFKKEFGYYHQAAKKKKEKERKKKRKGEISGRGSYSQELSQI